MNLRKAIVPLLFLLVLVSCPDAYSKGNGRVYRCPKPPVEEEAITKLAGDLFDRGEQLIDKRKFERGLKKFLCSAEMRDHINTTFNIAQAARYIKNKKKVTKYFEFFIETNPDTITSKELTKLVEHIKNDQ